MSGQPYKYSTDIERFRNDYLNSLNMRAEIDKMNLDANVVYKKTGNLPPITQMADNRTTDEILADVEKLKRELIGELAPIATPQFALQIISGIQASPLNSDGGLLTYFAQNITEFVTNLRKKYKYKIKGDQNDAAQFVLFVEDAYSKTRQLSGSVKTYFNRPLDSGAGGITVDDLNKVKSLMDEILVQYARGFSGNVNAGSTNGIITAVKAKIDAIRPNLDSQLRESYKNIIKGIQNLNMFDNEDILDSWQEYSNYLDALPTLNTLFTLGDQLKQASVNSKTDLSEQIAQNIYDLLPEISESRRINGMARRNMPPPPPGGSQSRGPPPSYSSVSGPPPQYGSSSGSSSSTGPPISSSPSANQSVGRSSGSNFNFQNVDGTPRWSHTMPPNSDIGDLIKYVATHERTGPSDVRLKAQGIDLNNPSVKLSQLPIPPGSTIEVQARNQKTQTTSRPKVTNTTAFSRSYTPQPDTGTPMIPAPRSQARYTGPDGSGLKRKKKFKDSAALISKMKSLLGNM
jgi:hypothetical protein